MSPKSLKPLAVDRVDLKVAEISESKRTSIHHPRNEAAEDLDDSALGCYDSLKNSEELYYEIDFDEKRASKQELGGSRASQAALPLQEDDKRVNEKADYTKSRSNVDHDESSKSSIKQSSHVSNKKSLTNKNRSIEQLSPKLIEGTAKIMFDAVDENNKRIKFIGVGRLSSPDTERSPKRYSQQLQDVKNTAASTIQLFYLYCIQKPKWQKTFNRKYMVQNKTFK